MSSSSTGQTLASRYRLGEPLGAGGYGAVYAAWDLQLEREVAIKIFDPKQAPGPQLQERFRREAVATASIRHPNVVRVFDVGAADDQIFIVMERLVGRPLTKELERWPHGMPAARALPLLISALEGLGAGHAAGVVHKDLKPSNLFLASPDTPGEKLAIIDFGVARVLHEQKLTATGKLVGTPRYLAPEYIEDLAVTAALDVYQMGLITVELLCGLPCLPRRLDLIASCQRHVDGDLDIPDGLRSGMIGEVIATATHVDPGQRFQTASDFAAALAAVNPDDVKITTPAGHLPTPRLGVKPLTKPEVHTQPMHGGREILKSSRASSLRAEEPAERPTRTGPTKRLGPAKDIAAKLEQPIAPAPDGLELKSPSLPIVVAPPPPARAAVPDGPTQTPDEPEPWLNGRRVVYALLLLALVSVSATVAFFVAQLARG